MCSKSGAGGEQCSSAEVQAANQPIGGRWPVGLESKLSVYGGRKFSLDSTTAGKIKKLIHISLSLRFSIVINRSLVVVLGLNSESSPYKC